MKKIREHFWKFVAEKKNRKIQAQRLKFDNKKMYRRKNCSLNNPKISA